MSLETMLLEAQAYLNGMGDVDDMRAMLPNIIHQLARACPVFGNTYVLYNRWQVGQYVDHAQTYAALTTSDQPTTSFPVSTLTPGDGLLIGAPARFDTVRFTVQTASSGGTPAYEFTYWDGTDWRGLTPQNTPTFSTLGVQTLHFTPPIDWVMQAPPSIVFPTGVTPQMFWVRMRALPPPSFAPALVQGMTVDMPVFPLPTNILQLISCHYFPRELEPANVGWGLDVLDSRWRTQRGMPNRYTQEITSTTQVRLSPIPSTTGTTGIPPFSGIPGALVPTNHVIALAIESPPVEFLSEWFEGLVAYALVAWEAQGEGDMQSLPLAQGMTALGNLLLGLLKGLYTLEGEEFIPDAWEMPLRERRYQYPS